MPEPPFDYTSADAFVTSATTLIREGVHDRRSPMRRALLATAEDNAASARWLVIRDVNDTPLRLVAYTDARSEKMGALECGACGEWVFWHPGRRLQVRMRGECRIIGERGRREAAWDAMSSGARRAWQVADAPGTPIERPRDAATRPEDAAFGDFVVFETTVQRIDVLWLRRGTPLRAVAEADAVASWVVP